MRSRTDTVRLSEGVSTRNECHCFFVVHAHAAESFADVFGGSYRVRNSVRAFRVYINETHLNGCERIFQLAAFAVPFVFQPFGFRTPVHIFFGFPYIHAATREAKGFETHVFERHVSGQYHEIGPGNAAAVFLFHRPQQAACFIEVGIVGPAVQRSKTLLPCARTAASIA